MPLRDIVTIGGSAGSIEALKSAVKNLPKDFCAAIFVTIHLSPRADSHLAAVLSRVSPIPVLPARDGQQITGGRIYVAVPDRHLLVSEDHIHLTRGPKEGLHRPSINVTFRSAAAAYGSRVVGVLLSGMLDDGASGLWDIAKSKGVVVVQDPAEAEFPSMPMNALQDVPVNHVSRVSEIASLLTKIVDGCEVPEMPESVHAPLSGPERLTGFTCPECRGPLFEHRLKPPEFRCRVGHLFPLKTLLEEHTITEERKLYEAIVALEEGADLAEYALARGDQGDCAQLTREAKQLREHASVVRSLIEQRVSAAID
jgi:two-component system, chemotaxis family, protein-glutamate methylesterase/glutaminase